MTKVDGLARPMPGARRSLEIRASIPPIVRIDTGRLHDHLSGAAPQVLEDGIQAAGA
jgi:hypothetical protein